jgi:hypothetical protein
MRERKGGRKFETSFDGKSSRSRRRRDESQRKNARRSKRNAKRLKCNVKKNETSVDASVKWTESREKRSETLSEKEDRETETETATATATAIDETTAHETEIARMMETETATEAAD